MSLGMFSLRETFCLMGTFCPIDVLSRGCFIRRTFRSSGVLSRGLLLRWDVLCSGIFCMLTFTVQYERGLAVGRFVLRDIVYAFSTVQHERWLAVGRFVLRDIVYALSTVLHAQGGQSL